MLKSAKNGVKQFVDSTMAHTYFEIGRMIVEEEQNGEECAKYNEKDFESAIITHIKKFNDEKQLKNTKRRADQKWLALLLFLV